MSAILDDAFEVLDGGVFAILVDPGRYGCAHLGLTQGGPMDPEAYQLANILLGNADRAQALEISLGGITLLARVNTRLCVTGACATLEVNGQPQPLWQSIAIREGDHIHLGRARQGLRNYLAVGGGFQISPQFGSATTVVREGIGGLHGRRLLAGDRLPACADNGRTLQQLPERYHPRYGQDLCLRLVPGYQYPLFAQAQKQAFFDATYKISVQADRMGYRLQGAAISPPDTRLWSEGICLGAVQVPGDGQPIVLLNDRQTIGGYHKLGAVLSLDCAQLAQAAPGTEVQFRAISQAQAKALLLGFRQRLARLKRALIAV